MGWCALDPRRGLLTGLEQRGCWQERPAAEPQPNEPGTPGTGRATVKSDDVPAIPRLDFIPVELIGPTPQAAPRLAPSALPRVDPDVQPATLPPPLAQAAAQSEESWTERTSLFGELEA